MKISFELDIVEPEGPWVSGGTENGEKIVHIQGEKDNVWHSDSISISWTILSMGPFGILTAGKDAISNV